jgi:hypothetical protein
MAVDGAVTNFVSLVYSGLVHSKGKSLPAEAPSDSRVRVVGNILVAGQPVNGVISEAQPRGARST